MNRPSLEADSCSIQISDQLDSERPGRRPAISDPSVSRRLTSNDEAILHYQSGHSQLLVLYHPALIAFRLRTGLGTVVVPRPAVTSVAGIGIRREADRRGGAPVVAVARACAAAAAVPGLLAGGVPAGAGTQQGKPFLA